MKNKKHDNSFHKRVPSFRKSVQRTIDKLSKLTKFEVPVSMTFKERRRNNIEVRLCARINGRILSGVGHGKNSFIALKNARKNFLRNYEYVKNSYNQRTLRVTKKMGKPLPFKIETILKPTDYLAS